MRSDEPSLRESPDAEADVRWHWRNCRSVGLGVSVWPLKWGFGLKRADDCYGGSINVELGPLNIEFSYSIGGLP
jgi:hypothetical protein